MSQHPGFGENLTALRSAQKPSRGTAAYSRLVNRPLGRIVAAWAHSVGISPNQATFVSAIFSGSAIALIALVKPTWWLGIVIAFLLAGGYVWDSVDGQLARLRGGGSKSGEWLDHTIDCFKTLTLHLAVLISWFRFAESDNDAWLLAPIAFTIIAAATYFGLILMPTLRPATTTDPSTLPPENPLRMFLILPTDYGFQCLLFVLSGWWLGFAIAYSTVAALCGLALTAALRKWWRELRELDGAPA
ncbi:MAG: CDP-alcohol phosphatidyltransferase family protein [Aeromicrobium sp.]|nr:MAG: CDP-alcohol phosphatidyltransferase family protein [Aeromicrobium sp.]